MTEERSDILAGLLTDIEEAVLLQDGVASQDALAALIVWRYHTVLEKNAL